MSDTFADSKYHTHGTFNDGAYKGDTPNSQVIKHAASKLGRPTLYRPEVCEEMLKYFSEAPQQVTQPVKVTIEESRKWGHSQKQEVQTICAELPTFQRFANSIGVNSGTLLDWAKKYPDFREAHLRCAEIQEDAIIQGLWSGRAPGMGGIFVAKNITRFTDDRTLNVATVDSKEKPPLAERTPAQLEALKAAVLAAEAAGVKLVIADEETTTA